MRRVPTNKKRLEDYRSLVSEQLIADIRKAAEKLRGLRIVHINATPQGGGVAEILKSLTPLMCDTGIDAEWYALSPNESFFRVSKTLHHCLQGQASAPSDLDMDLYLKYNQESASALESMGVDADLWIFHDVQVLPMPSFMDSWLGAWVCHVDTTRPNEKVREMLFPYMRNYPTMVASMPEYFNPGVHHNEIVVFPPAIDPLQPKHAHLTYENARSVLAGLGMDPYRPIVSQVSRFDFWKDPTGVVDAYRLANKRAGDIQLALVGAMTAKDDYDAFEVLAELQRYAKGDPDIHVYYDPTVIKDPQVNAFQSGSDVILQKSLREGFGLTVTEAMWKQRPVIGGNCGGIKLQIIDGETGFLVNDVIACADRIVTLLNDPQLAQRVGVAAREAVRKNHLMPRLLLDYLNLASMLMEKQGMASAADGGITMAS